VTRYVMPGDGVLCLRCPSLRSFQLELVEYAVVLKKAFLTQRLKRAA